MKTMSINAKMYADWNYRHGGQNHTIAYFSFLDGEKAQRKADRERMSEWLASVSLEDYISDRKALVDDFLNEFGSTEDI